MPNNRKTYIGLMGNLLPVGEKLFAANEFGHPASLAAYLGGRYQSRPTSARKPEPPVRQYAPTLDADRINAINRANMERLMPPPMVPLPGQPYPPQPNR